MSFEFQDTSTLIQPQNNNEPQNNNDRNYFIFIVSIILIFLLLYLNCQNCNHRVCVCNQKEKDRLSPSYYRDGKIEVWDFIEDKNLNFNKGNAIKYISRAGKKNKDKEVEDLKNAIVYLNREIYLLENKTEEKRQPYSR